MELAAERVGEVELVVEHGLAVVLGGLHVDEELGLLHLVRVRVRVRLRLRVKVWVGVGVRVGVRVRFRVRARARVGVRRGWVRVSSTAGESSWVGAGTAEVAAAVAASGGAAASSR